jgi:hypothetical protein
MQIYHTSHCGSTLLTTLLSEVISSYSEPSWCHKIIAGENIDFAKEIEKYKHSVIKLPSGLCHYACQTEDKKIFLYRNLKNHLFKLIVLDGNRYNYLNYYYEYFQKNIHPKLKEINFDNDGKKHVFLWCNRIFWLLDSSNVAAVNSNIFFENKKETLHQICEFFEVKKIKNFLYQNYDVKMIGLNHNEMEISKVSPNLENRRVTYPSYGIIEDEICLNDEGVMQLVDWAKEYIEIPEFLL